MMKHIKKILFFCLLAMCVAYYLNAPKSLKEPVFINIHPGIKLSQLSEELKQKQLIVSSAYFYYYVRILHSFKEFKAGKYRFDGVVTPSLLVKAFSQGNTYHELMLELKIPEGYTIYQVFSQLEALNYSEMKLWVKLSQDQIFLQSLGLTEAKTLEGFLYPATYTFYDTRPSEVEIISRMVSEFFKRLPENYEKDVKAKSLTFYDAIKFASLIEKETALEREKSFVSEVIWNRLNHHDYLGIDASLIYGIKDYDGNIRTAHLRDRSNLYNSRVHKGLPPTPICSPTSSSLKAVLNPSNNGYYYYVLNSETMQDHHFTNTLKEHNYFVKKLIEKKR